MQPTIKQLTFRSGTVRGARFAPDGKNVIYGAAWEGRQLGSMPCASRAPRSKLSVAAPADPHLAISSTGELAIGLKAASNGPFVVAGTLARARWPAAARASCSRTSSPPIGVPTDRSYAIVRAFASPRTTRVAYPKSAPCLYRAPFWISDVPDLARRANSWPFVTHAIGGDEGDVEVIDLGSKGGGRCRRAGSASGGLAWAPWRT